MNLTFTFDDSKVRWNINKLMSEFKSRKFGYGVIKQNQVAIVEKNVKNRLQTNSKRDPTATPPGTGEHIRKILETIKTRLLPYDNAKMSWFCGTGNIDELQASNWISETGKAVWLWKILEKGAKEHLISAVLKPSLKFYWYRYGIWVEKEQVQHPGQEGRHYFLTIDDAIYESDKLLVDRIYDGVLRTVAKYSYKEV